MTEPLITNESASMGWRAIRWHLWRDAIAAHRADPELLEAFRQRWCRYDSPGAATIAADGKRGHYLRPQTLSSGDPLCYMCWKARGSGQMPKSQKEKDKQC